MDDRDPECFHVLAFDAHDTAVGTGRIDLADGGRIGRMAVLATHRGCGIGRALLEALHAHARECGLAEVWCHAQIAAKRFYEAAGYAPEGDTFIEAGIDHTTMRRIL
jgi:predicted GNAT family N-acyltransferase